MKGLEGIIRIEDLFPGELEELLRSGHDAAVLPVGSVEQHGPHLPLGCDGYTAAIIARYTARYAGAVLFPMMPFSWIGGLRAWPGTMDMRPWVTGDYLKETLLSIIRMGFRRVMVINCHGGGYEMVFSTVQTVYHMTGVHVLSMYPSRVYDAFPEIEEVWKKDGGEIDWNAIESGEMMGCLKDMGQMDFLQHVQENATAEYKKWGDGPLVVGPESFMRARLLGSVGHDYLEENRHVQPRPSSDPDAGIRAADLFGQKLAQMLKEIGDWEREYEGRNKQ